MRQLIRLHCWRIANCIPSNKLQWNLNEKRKFPVKKCICICMATNHRRYCTGFKRLNATKYIRKMKTWKFCAATIYTINHGINPLCAELFWGNTNIYCISINFMHWQGADSCNPLLNSLRPSDAYMRQWTRPRLIQRSTCPLFNGSGHQQSWYLHRFTKYQGPFY